MSSKSPLKSLKFQAALLAVAQAGFACGLLASVRGVPDMLLKGERNVYFLSLYDEFAVDARQEHVGDATHGAPSEGRTEGQATNARQIHPAAVSAVKVIEWAPVNHCDLYGQTVTRSLEATRDFTFVDSHAALTVEESSEVGVSIHQGPRKISGELGGQPMPGSSRSAEGQYRTKQAERPGVCNEQGPDPKGKVCSELGGNVESETETISSRVDDTTRGNSIVYHRTCNVPVRFVRPGGQGSTADPTWEALDYMGRSWYWDRQCPAGRAYALRTDDTFFMVDPRFVFKWTGDLTYPDQMAFTRLCGLRFFLNTSRRMFQAVYDGVTA